MAAILSDAGAPACDVSALGDGPDGYSIDRPMSARAAIEPLAQAFAFDAAEDGDQLVFRPRGGAPVIELTDADCVLPDRGAPLRLTRAQETELPREVSLGFVDGRNDYRRGAASSRRLVGSSTRLVQSDIAMVTGGKAAERRADIWLQDLWAGRESADFALPPSRIALTPGDVIALTADGRRRLFEIRDIVDTGSRAVKARSIDPEIFNLPLEPDVGAAPPVPPPIGPVEVRLLDLPVFDAAEPVVLTRAAVFADPWPGPVAIWRSSDGASYERAAVAFAPAIVGETLDPLPNGPVGSFRRRQQRSRAALWRRARVGVRSRAARRRQSGGAAASGWRLRDHPVRAMPNWSATASTRLSRLLRGQGGTEWAIADPLPVGAGFVLLDEHVVPVARGLEMLGRPLSLRIVAAERDHGDAAAVAVETTPQGVSLRPYAPVHLRAVRGGSGIVLSWIRRTRLDGNSWEAEEVPLGEAAERYEIDILDGTTVRRVLQSSTAQVLYPSADEIADFGAPLAAISLRVVQMSALVGRGYPAEAVVSVGLNLARHHGPCADRPGCGGCDVATDRIPVEVARGNADRIDGVDKGRNAPFQKLDVTAVLHRQPELPHEQK